jgi:ribonuclease T2
MPIRLLLIAALLATLTACTSAPRPTHSEDFSRSKREYATSQQQASADFDYYLLSLSWAPNFCATHSGSANECGTGRNVAFVVHGLWPQSERGRLDEHCQHTSPVSAEVVRYAINFYPDAGLVQHEWQCHGIYSGLSARDYFTAAGHAYQSLQIPPSVATLTQDTQLRASALTRQFEQANGAPEGSFVTSCHDGELVAVEACFTKDLKLRACSPAQRGCSGSLLLRAPR